MDYVVRARLKVGQRVYQRGDRLDEADAYEEFGDAIERLVRVGHLAAVPTPPAESSRKKGPRS